MASNDNETPTKAAEAAEAAKAAKEARKPSASASASALASSSSVSLDEYPQPLIIPPSSGTLRQAFIVLHGRGSDASAFGPPLLSTVMLDGGTLLTAFPHAQFIFPTASYRRARLYKRSRIHQWFDNWDLKTPEEREEYQNEGLRETSEFVHQLIRQQVEKLGTQNVLIGGLSQGCAASLISMLLLEGNPLAGVIGMCGWLPYRMKMEEAIQENQDEDEDRIFHPVLSDGQEPHSTPTTTRQKAVSFLCEEIEFPTFSATATTDSKPGPQSRSGPALKSTPVFLGHGTQDDRVPIALGRSAAHLLESLQVNVHWHEYSNLGHWYSAEMLSDVVCFIRAHCEGWKVCA